MLLAIMPTTKGIKAMTMSDFQVGDLIKFKSVTRWSNAAVWRVVKELTQDGGAMVRFGGWDRFVVRNNEIIDYRKRSA
jgi:hypothetical protein